MLLSGLEHEDFAKSRRALIISSTTVLVLAVVEPLNDVMTIFAIDFRFEHAKLLLLTQMFVAFFLVNFLFKSSGFLISFWEERVRSKYAYDAADVRREAYDQLGIEGYAGGKEQLEAMIDSQIAKRERLLTNRVQRVKNSQKLVEVLETFFIGMLVPVALAIAAILHPEALTILFDALM